MSGEGRGFLLSLATSARERQLHEGYHQEERKGHAMQRMLEEGMLSIHKYL